MILFFYHFDPGTFQSHFQANAGINSKPLVREQEKIAGGGRARGGEEDGGEEKEKKGVSDGNEGKLICALEPFIVFNRFIIQPRVIRSNDFSYVRT